MVRDRSTYAEVVLLSSKKGGHSEWKVHVWYDTDCYLVLLAGGMVTVYRQMELPHTLGTTLHWPAGVTGVRAAAIESVRRVRNGEVG